MTQMTGGEAIVESLVRHGIDTLFGLPGVQVYGLFDALARNSERIRVISARHEQTTAYMALGYACTTGKPAVFSVVPGPGIMNTSAALVTAWSLNAPVLAITGQIPTRMIGKRRGQLHEMPDQLATLRGIVKWAERIEHPVQASQLIGRAFQEMTSDRRGPVALEMAWDQFTAMSEVAISEPLPRHAQLAFDTPQIEALARAIAEAKAPMIWVGGGAIDAASEIAQLAERIEAPVVSFRTGRGILDDRHPLALNVAAAYRLWPDTDLLIGIGTRLETPIDRWPKRPVGLKTARIDIDPAELRRLKVDIGIVADANAATNGLLTTLAPVMRKSRMAAIADAKAAAADDVRGLQPQMSFLDVIREELPEDGILCDEMTQVGYVSWIGFPFYTPRSLITSGFSGTLGAGFPMALGAKVAYPNRQVVSVTGDGGFLFAGVELATAVQHGINLVTVVFNNGAYGNVLRDQRRLFAGRSVGAELQNPDFQLFAKSFGVPSWRATDAKGLKIALKEALAGNTPALIEVVTDIAKEAEPWRFLAPGRA
jgi:acetolactate synthase I/II/III large subunit